MEPDQRDTLSKLVEEILNSADSTKGTTTLVQHEISVKPDAKPVRQAVRRISPKILEFAQQEVERMKNENIIEPSKNEWCSRPVIVKKTE